MQAPAAVHDLDTETTKNMPNEQRKASPTTNDPSSRKAINWIAVECDYRAGNKPLRLLADEHGITHGAINKRAKRDGWTRDLASKIKAAADAKVSKAVVSAAVSADTKITEKLTVEVEATVQSRVRLTHRADIRSARNLAMRLLAELEHQTVNIEPYQHLSELVITGSVDEGANPERMRKLSEAFERAMSLASRTKIMKDLADTLRILIDKEREAFNIGDSQNELPDDPKVAIAAFFAQLHQSGAGRLKFSPPRRNP